MASNLTHPTQNQFFRTPATNETILQAKHMKGWFIVLKNIRRHSALQPHRFIPYDFASSQRIWGDYVTPSLWIRWEALFFTRLMQRKQSNIFHLHGGT